MYYQGRKISELQQVTIINETPEERKEPPLSESELRKKRLRQMLQNPAHILTTEERQDISEVVFDGVPADLRALFWRKASGIDAYKTCYINDYYKTLC